MSLSCCNRQRRSNLKPTPASQRLEPVRAPSVHRTACYTCPIPPSIRKSQSPRAGLNWTDQTCFQLDPAESIEACHHCYESAPSCFPRLQPATRVHRRPNVSRVSSDRIIVTYANKPSAVSFASCAGCLRGVVYCYGQKPSRATAIIHSAMECISQIVRYKSGKMEWRKRWRGDVVTEVKEESVMNIQSRCCRQRDP
jgi:hypothetical protein